MASLVIGAAGAALGSMFGPFGAAIGWGIGQMVGGMLDPPKTQGPRLSDLKLQTSQYGQMIPLSWGTDRLPVQIIWQTDLKEHSSTSHAGKGGHGPSVTTYSYSASFAALICEGPIDGVVEVWVDQRKVFDGTNAGQFPFTLYYGDETQLPDPTMEAELGAGKVPPFRGYAYMVFKDLDLSPYGNRLPNITVLVTHNLQPNIKRLTTWETPYTPYWSVSSRFNPAVAYDGQYLTFSRMEGVDGFFPNDGAAFHAKFYAVAEVYDEYGNLIQQQRPASEADHSRGHCIFAYKCKNLPGWEYCQITEGDFIRHPDTYPERSFWLHGFKGAGCLDPDGMPYVCMADFVASWDGSKFYMLGDRDHVTSGAAWGQGAGGGAVLRVFSAGGVSSGAVAYATAVSTADSGDQLNINIDTDGTLWVSGYSYLAHIRDTGSALEIIEQWLDIRTDYGSGYENFGAFGCWCNGRVFKVTFAGNPGLCKVGVIGPVTGVPTNWKLLAEFTLSPDNRPYAESTSMQVANLGNGLAWVNDGMFSICADKGGTTLLSTIVHDLSIRAGYVESEFDVSELTDVVNGYSIGNRATYRAAIEQLMLAYYFDVTESDGKIKFVKRGKPSMLTIPDADLGAFPADSGDPPPLVEYTRAQELDLPRSVIVTFRDINFDYQNGTASETRQTGEASDVVQVEVPVAMDYAKALEIVRSQLYIAYRERDKAAISLPQKYLKLDPTDVITVQSIAYRIAQCDASPYGVIKVDLIASPVQVWSGGVPPGSGSGVDPGGGGTGGGGTPPGEGPGVPYTQKTILRLLDIPYLDTPDGAQEKLFIGLGSASNPAWPGAAVYKTYDPAIDATYGMYIDSQTQLQDTMGYTTTVLRHFPGGNVFDEVSSVTVIMYTGAQLQSTTRDKMLQNGANEALIGMEIVQFRDATLNDDGTYTLRGFLRGRRGTEIFMGTHVIREEFTLLPVNLSPAAIRSDYGVTTYWKAVTAGQTLAQTLGALQFRNSGMPITPYAPVLTGAGRNGAGDWILTWTRRTRVHGEWVDYVDVPVGEASERYRVTLYSDDTYQTEVTSIDGITEPGYALTAADQTTYFGSPQSVLYWTVAQLGIIGPGFDSFGRQPKMILTDPLPSDTPDANVPVLPTPSSGAAPSPSFPGTQWHPSERFSSSLTGAKKNFNYLQDYFGTSWSLAYLCASHTDIASAFATLISDADEVQRIKRTMSGEHYLAPVGFIVPWGPRVSGGPGSGVFQGIPDWPLMLSGFMGSLSAGGMRIKLPYADDNVTIL